MFTIYAVYPADYKPTEQAVAIFADRTEAQFYIDACKDQDREFSADLIIQEWDVSNIAFMEAI